MSEAVVYIGVDVSKDSLDVDSFDSKNAHLANSESGIRHLAKRIKKFPQKIIVCCEATGGYEELLCKMLYAEGIDVARVNPRCARDFARSKNIIAKTDKIDSKVLSLFGAASQPKLYTPPPQ